MNKIDVQKLNEEELMEIQELISNKLSAILNKADKDANKFLSKYGLKAQIVFELKKQDQK